ncbi:hypothetical protein ASPZODRAFT_423773 [Penicilliopsis zonata CBS 506.65]|uniref:C2H2-type domain-containing protein n=1 Tax=Penicilliopsis zonata CBS 506.65 TaxID=1073090 RepID=A0A1L9SWL6_9EURO|nr:hypothetical protein ASPZODRAFT_423773 [Penicilliopsis zonata CBS 506.65]OJJ51598.1 hypothetical protein ASPZODRAFT_423773 [Penicilliopsis zonata CBS 506.65]
MMLANPHSTLHERHRQHRRQISTPSALEAAKAPSLPGPVLQRYNAHRRGQSLDSRSLPPQLLKTVKDGALPSNTNQMLYQQPQQVLREAQQQRLKHQPVPAQMQKPSTMLYIADRQLFNGNDLRASTNHYSNENDPTLACLKPKVASPNSSGSTNQPLRLALERMDQQRNNSQFYTTHHASQAWMQDNMAAFPQQAGLRRLSVQSIQSDISPRTSRPQTPTKQMNTSYFPMTPASTPFRTSAEIATYRGNVQVSPTKSQCFSVPHVSDPSFMQRARSLQGVPGAISAQQKFEVSSPSNNASFELDGLDLFDGRYESSLESSAPRLHTRNQFSISSSSSSSASSSFYSSPEMAAMPSPKEKVQQLQKLPIYPMTPRHSSPKKPSVSTPASSPVKAKLSPRIATIDSLNLDNRVQASIKETGITIDEIASYIHGPDPEDGKWVCLHPGCERRFGRKENIKSHVQTHLGDRQYKCDHCNKCFVRGHDLKRHAKIHTGDKPYECLCGNVFARHDALTRHRQRGMCIGGYKGIVRKTTKRGRPKKQRPELEERQEKASRTRQKVAAKSSSVSVTGSDSSHNSPPSDIFDSMSIRCSSPFEDAPAFHAPDYSIQPGVLTFTPPASPHASTSARSSASKSDRSLTPGTEDGLPSLPTSGRALEKILEEPTFNMIEPISFMDNDAIMSSSSHTMSSPPSAPTLTDSSIGSELDVFISQEAPTDFDKHDLGLQSPDMAHFPDYVTVPGFDTGLNLFYGKSFSTNESAASDEFFSFQFQADEQPTDIFFH